ncbi:MAG: HEAT repeat domain-containing protein [Nitrospirota bacterium]|nr:HEAT repeat domain-containing protein [Nitrospirota bacterium]MDP2382073.1 HEAT repeat domain-containing protein [Nitrospirota bacterium]MDP3598092.1 HEAT repeat domain-containing protein [Nitrospirota bacterium]
MSRYHRPRKHQFVFASLFMTVGALLIGIAPDVSQARKELLTSVEKEQMRRTETIYLEVIALTLRGAIDSAPVTKAATARLEQLGYRVIPEAGQPAEDVTVKVKCEEAKTWEGTGRSGGDADMVDAAMRLWKGPACQVSYRFGSRTSNWRHEVRAEFSDAQEAAKKAGQPDSGAYAVAALSEQIRKDTFPFLLAAELGQSSRLVPALDAASTTSGQKVTLIDLLGNMMSIETIPRLIAALKDPDPAIVHAAATALGTIGHEDGIPPLLSLYKSSTPEQHRAAAVGLGRLAPLHPNSDIVPTLLGTLLQEPVPTQIILVRALSKTTDRRALDPLRSLNRSILTQARNDTSPELKELKATIRTALDQLYGPHTEE